MNSPRGFQHGGVQPNKTERSLSGVESCLTESFSHLNQKEENKSSLLVSCGPELACTFTCVLASTYLQSNVMSSHKVVYCYKSSGECGSVIDIAGGRREESEQC